MVEFELADYKTIIKWFELAFGKNEIEKIALIDKKTFWKITFLCEDKIKEESPQTHDEEE